MRDRTLRVHRLNDDDKILAAEESDKQVNCCESAHCSVCVSMYITMKCEWTENVARCLNPDKKWYSSKTRSALRRRTPARAILLFSFAILVHTRRPTDTRISTCIYIAIDGDIKILESCQTAGDTERYFSRDPRNELAAEPPIVVEITLKKRNTTRRGFSRRAYF